MHVISRKVLREFCEQHADACEALFDWYRVASRAKKMTHTFDAKSYTDLLVRYQPKPIATEVENDAAIALAHEIEHRPLRSPEEELFLELLVTLIEKFEAEHYPIPKSTTGSILQNLMDARELEPSVLVPILNTEATISEVLAGRRAISQDEARRLAEFFRVDMHLFLESE